MKLERERYLWSLDSVVRVKDGDTFIAVLGLDVELGFGHREHKQFTETLRLKGMDCPEEDEPGFDEATDYTRDWLDAAIGRGTVVETFKPPEGRDEGMADAKFGRWLATLTAYDGEVLNDVLVQHRLAVWWTK